MMRTRTDTFNKLNDVANALAAHIESNTAATVSLLGKFNSVERAFEEHRANLIS